MNAQRPAERPLAPTRRSALALRMSLPAAASLLAALWWGVSEFLALQRAARRSR
ncbi:MAG: hypothetical protein MUC68_15110 [Burkholderiaceae bacterium]|jgi:hypothetical protein|nr:hypothetical protein [Burkholderiaceae bacterium]